jgi:hypothetical protein
MGRVRRKLNSRLRRLDKLIWPNGTPFQCLTMAKVHFQDFGEFLAHTREVCVSRVSRLSSTFLLSLLIIGEFFLVNRAPIDGP